jgi:hypothetical protein
VKIDTQGAELDVLQGGREVIRHADYVLLEASLADYNPGAGRAEEIFAALAEMGFITMEPTNLFRWEGQRKERSFRSTVCSSAGFHGQPKDQA